jgi:hypothetical protein
MNPIQREAKSVEMTSENHHHGAGGGLRRLRRPQPVTFLAMLAAVAAIPVAAGAASGGAALAAPTGLQTFQLRTGDHSGGRDLRSLAVPTFSRTPSFAWTPVRGTTRYEFELSTDETFRSQNAVIWSSTTLTTPAAAVPISLPWITGDGGSLYWHVRAYGAGGVSRWSSPARFDMRWSDIRNGDPGDDVLGVPQQLAGEPGYVRWTPVEGATGYDVWYENLGADGNGVSVSKIFSTITTVADEREFVTEHAPESLVLWRVRARRQLYGQAANRLPRASYGPWSQVYRSTAGNVQPMTPDDAVPLRTVSDGAHTSMPVFVWSLDSFQYHRIYVSTDRDCVNTVYAGSVVGGTSFAPRVTGPLALADDKKDATGSFLLDGDEGKTLRSDGQAMPSNETIAKDGGATGKGSKSAAGQPPHVDLWDSTGRYYWTVVPVIARQDGSTRYFQDLRLPQDLCQQGHVLAFAKRSVDPQLADGLAPYVTGLSPSGRLLSAVNRQTSFYGVPLVAWKPATGATSYDVQWSRTSYPWRAVGRLSTPSTSAMLPLAPGTWWYRVRGNDPYLDGNTKLAWSAPLRIQIAEPTFSVSRG